MSTLMTPAPLLKEPLADESATNPERATLGAPLEQTDSSAVGGPTGIGAAAITGAVQGVSARQAADTAESVAQFGRACFARVEGGRSRAFDEVAPQLELEWAYCANGREQPWADIKHLVREAWELRHGNS